jgi:predicted ATPase/DNA-binding CsgD family transcriptional regulator
MTAARRITGPAPDLTTFVGREHELDEAARLLRVARLVTLLGVGGVGKTRLALRIAAQRRPESFDDVYLADLSTLDDPGLVEATLAEALGISDESGALTAGDIAVQLADRRTLVVLDNCEHVLDRCAALAGTLLAASPGVTLLATSRQPLGLTGEHVLPVPPLAAPWPGDHAEPAELARSPAVALFLDRARAAVPGFALTAENGRAVAAVCAALDGLPLALELAVVRLRALSPAQLLERLEVRPDQALRGTDRTAQPRHRSLASLMDWSFRLCDEQERILWARVSVFAGGFDLEAAERVCSGGGIDEDTVADLVAGLVDKSVLLREDHGSHVRYRLLETVRRYGRSRLAESGEEAQLRRRHREHVQCVVDAAAAHWFGPDDLAWLDRMRLDHANLRAALESCTRSPADAEDGLRLATTFWLMWRTAGRVTEGRHWLDRLLACEPAPSPATATALWVNGWLALIQGDHDRARELLHRSEEISRDRDDRVAIAFVDLFLGQAAILDGELDEAERRLRRALPIHRGTGDPAGLIMTTFRLAVRHAAAGDADAAVATADECLRLCRERGARWWSGYARWIKGVALWCGGDPASAAEEAIESLAITRALGDELGSARALEVVAWVTVGSDPLRAAQILGTVHRQCSELAGYGDLADHHERCSTEARRRLGDDRFAAAHAHGAGQRIDEVVDLVLHGRDEDGGPDTPLTRREHEVAELIAQGKTNKAIARALGIAHRTADAHAEHIRAKLGVSSRSQIAAWIVERRTRASSTG